MSAWLKAGLIGGAILAVLNIIGVVPFLTCITLPLTLLLYVVVGIMAASYIPPKREAGAGAGQGALAAFLAALIGGAANTVIVTLTMVFGGVGRRFAQLPPQVLRQLRDAGISPRMFEGTAGIGAGLLGGAVCCLAGVLIAVVLGAIGGALYAALKPE